MGFDSDTNNLFKRYSLIREQGFLSPPGPGEQNQELLNLYKKIQDAANKKDSASYNQAAADYNKKYMELYPSDTMGRLKKDIGGLFGGQQQNTQPQAYQPTPKTPSIPTQQTTQPQQQVTPTTVNYNNPGYGTGAIDKAVQSVLQQNPNFNADMLSQQLKNNIKQNIDTLASIGMSEAEIQKRIAPTIKQLADQVPSYANTPNYQRQDTQQNVTGRSVQQVYGMPQNQQYKNPFNPQGQKYNQQQPTNSSLPSQQPSTSSLPVQQQANNAQPWYKRPYNSQMSATKGY